MEHYRGTPLANPLARAARGAARWDAAKPPVETLREAGFDSIAAWSKGSTWRMDWDEAFIRLYVDDWLLNGLTCPRVNRTEDQPIRSASRTTSS